jgi:AcrR family transcriptional regulator
MARPFQANAAATRQRILKAATHLFAMHGEGTTSMRQIARDAGVVQATIHHYYESKERLYEACTEAMVADVEQEVERLAGRLNEKLSVTDAVQEAVRLAYRYVGAHRATARLLNRQILETGSGSHAAYQALLMSLMKAATPRLLKDSSLDQNELHIALYGLICLMVRISVSEPQEIARLAPGVGRHDLERYLGNLAVRMLGCSLRVD